MTLEERLQQMIGQQAFTIAVLQTELEKAQKRILELDGSAPEIKSGNGSQHPSIQVPA
jgi:hypothetical protein